MFHIAYRRTLLLALVFAMLVLPGAAAVHWQPVQARQARSFNNPPTSTSGADPAYPLNHTLDGTAVQLGGPSNSDFETAGGSVGSPPTNSGFSTGDFTGWTTSGSTSIQSDGGNYFAEVDSGSITSSAFTLASTAQSVSLRAKSTFIFAGQFTVNLLSGSSYSTSTALTPGLATTSSWQTFSFNIAAFAGQSVKLQVVETTWNVGVDDVGLQTQDIPSWTPSGAVTLQSGGPTGNFVQIPTNGSLVSAPFTVSSSAQQLRLSYVGAGSTASFYLEALSGTGYATVTDLVGSTIVEDPSTWKTIKAGIAAFAGQSIELRIRQYIGGAGNFDNAGLMESVLPGWGLVGVGAIAAASDTNGTYVTTDAPTGNLLIQSSPITPGIITPAVGSGARFYAVAYSIGYSTGDLLRITWYNSANGDNWVAFTAAADNPTGYTLGWSCPGLVDTEGWDGRS